MMQNSNSVENGPLRANSFQNQKIKHHSVTGREACGFLATGVSVASERFVKHCRHFLKFAIRFYQTGYVFFKKRMFQNVDACFPALALAML